MRVWRNATLYFGIVQVPVGVAVSTTDTAKITFKTLHKECGTPISTEKECGTCLASGIPGASHLGKDDLIRGYELSKGQFLPITDEEFESVDSERSNLVEITKTIREFDPLRIKKSYWLIPGVADRSYRLLAYALDAAGLVAVGMSKLGKETPCVIESKNGVLQLHMLYSHAEMVTKDFEVPKLDPGDPRTASEMEMALSAVWSFNEHLDDELTALDLTTTPDALIRSLIASKAQGEEFHVPALEAAPEPSGDLLEAFKETMALKAAA